MKRASCSWVLFIAMTARYNGTIKSFSQQSGYGFIACPEVFEQYGHDVYVMKKILELSQVDPSVCFPGAPVSFTIQMTPDGKPQASQVKMFAGLAPAGVQKGDGKGYNSKGAWNGGKGKAMSFQAPAAKGSWGNSWASPAQPAGNAAGASSAVDSAQLDAAVKEAVGGTACARAGSGFALDGSPMVEISLNTLNVLLKAVGHEGVQGTADIPNSAETLPGFDGNPVVGPWFVGKVKEYLPEQAFGHIESEGFTKQFPDKELFVHGDHLDPSGTGDMMAKVGDEIFFPLVEDEEGNAWAWAPIIPKTKSFIGTVRKWEGDTHCYLACDALTPVFGCDVYCHKDAAEFGGCDTSIGSPVVFCLHVNQKGKPQASSPRPPGVSLDGLYASRKGSSKGAKRPQGDEWGMAASLLALANGSQWSAGPPAKKRKVDPLTPLSDEWYSGDVKSFNPMKGFGFINCEETFNSYGRDVFIHSNFVEDENALAVGALVSFQVALNAKGEPQATNLKLA